MKWTDWIWAPQRPGSTRGWPNYIFGGRMRTSTAALILAFFMVKDGPKFLPWTRRVCGERAGGDPAGHPHLLDHLGRLHPRFVAFPRGRLAHVLGAGNRRGHRSCRRHRAGPEGGPYRHVAMLAFRHAGHPGTFVRPDELP